MENKPVHRIDSISEFHKIRQLPKPEHPLISVVDYSSIIHTPENHHVSWLQGYYSIALKKDVPGKYRYGQQEYDFDEGLMSFFAPNQILNINYVEKDKNKEPSGWILLIHPDFLWNTPLANTIKNYEFFDYSLTEALFLSEKEEKVVAEIFRNIKQEYQANMDRFSQDIIISQIQLLLNYAQRFYERQFITRKQQNHEILSRFEEVVKDFFERKAQVKGLPTVNFVAEALHVSPNYLSSTLKHLTGLNAQQHIHEKLVERAKLKLSTTTLSVSEIAYELGFEHPQSFSKLFKTKTSFSPREFRKSFN
ncbi:AraC family transcriptional regulator [Maribacter algicola]|uniref:AraC family transcriptional regulator n=1 Tax=Maribacter algicola TaxID=2498892 RepID=A0A426RLD9_9FLAO|nr:response regulator transcription factor [Maribacter algicola]RRQ49749.1 AraC family transcriptional regulator [Maribacter algicola]